MSRVYINLRHNIHVYHESGSKSPQSFDESCLVPPFADQDGCAGLDGARIVPSAGPVGSCGAITGIVAITGTLGTMGAKGADGRVIL